MSKVEEYQQAILAVQQAEQTAKEIARALSSIAQIVENWKCVRIPGANVPDAMVLNDNLPSISSDDWPTFEQFRAAVGEYHEASRKAQNFWLNMTQNEKAGLTPPRGI